MFGRHFCLLCLRGVVSPGLLCLVASDVQSKHGSRVALSASPLTGSQVKQQEHIRKKTAKNKDDTEHGGLLCLNTAEAMGLVTEMKERFSKINKVQC